MLFPGGSVGKESTYKAGDTGSIPGLGKSPKEGNGNPLQYSCLGNPTDRGAWQAIVHGVTRIGNVVATKLPPQMSLTIVMISKDFFPGNESMSLTSRHS